MLIFSNDKITDLEHYDTDCSNDRQDKSIAQQIAFITF